MVKNSKALLEVNSIPSFEIIPIASWNAKTFNDFMVYLNREKYNSHYIINNKRVESTMLKRLTKEYGNAVVKKFIELCFDNYRPKGHYTSMNIAFMYSYLRESYLGAAIQMLEEPEEVVEQVNTDQDNSWF